MEVEGLSSPVPTTDVENIHVHGDDNGMTSEVLEGGNFQDELQIAFEDSNYFFPGEFYHASLLSNPPNPCLRIYGLGVVGLPLSDRDARALISCATLAPCGHGERTAVDTVVSNTWEIEPDKLAFANPQWADYLTTTVHYQVCYSLGVDIYYKQSKLELNKLLLCEKGSQFLTRHDAQKASDVFATVIIILPSEYTGGEVILSHSSLKQTVNFAQESPFSMALLAWYTDVKHETKEVTSGYRLALSFNLIHVASLGVPPPRFPDMSHSMGLLRRVLKKWRDGQYTERKDSHMAACILNKYYLSFRPEDGIKSLKNKVEAHKATYFQSVAEELGFMVWIGILKELRVAGRGYNRFCGYYRRWNHGDENTTHLGITGTTITKVVQFDGESAFISTGTCLSIDNDCIIPKNAFQNEKPDSAEYAGSVRMNCYRRVALVLVEESHVEDIRYKADGAVYAYQRLKRSCTIPPTNDDIMWAKRLLSNHTSLDETYVLTLMDYALKWNDLEIWKGVMKCTSCTLRNIEGALLVKAWSSFSFQSVFTSFEEILARSTGLHDQMNFIYSLPLHCKEEERQTVRAWCQKESDKILASHSKCSVEAIPTIMFIINKAGLESFSRTMMPNLLRRAGNYTFFIALRMALANGRHSILQHQPYVPFIVTPDITPASAMVDSASPVPPKPVEADVALNQTSSRDLLKKLMKDCLLAASTQWSNPQNISGPQNEMIDRIIQIFAHAIATNDMDIIRAMIDQIIKSPGIQFAHISTTLIPRLKTLLSKTEFSLYVSPFIILIQHLIGLQLHYVLGKLGNPVSVVLRKIGCACPDCPDCSHLDNFILDPVSSTMTFRLAQKRRLHLEKRAALARDLCSYITIKSGSPYAVEITKHPDIVAAGHWDNRQKDARAFLSNIGTDADISRIMGARYPEVVLALEGVRQFEMENQDEASNMSNQNTIAANNGRTTALQPIASPSSAIVHPQLPATPETRACGEKRKSEY